MSKSNVRSIQELIEDAFGDPKLNAVNFKLIQTLLFLLARQLRVLDRQVKVKMGYKQSLSSSILSVSEIKIHANAPMKGTGSAIKINRKKSDLIPVGANIFDKTKIIRQDFIKEDEDDVEVEEDINTKSTKIDKLMAFGKRDDIIAKDSQKSGSSKKKDETRKTKSKSPPIDSIIDDIQNKKKYLTLLERIEVEREKVLRIIEQRANSHQDNIHPPTPIAPLSSTEIQYEKLLIVDRITSEEAETQKQIRDRRTPELSIVTQEEFDALVERVKILEKMYGPVGMPAFPENVQLMQDLRRGASLTDAMAALQLSARIDATEHAIKRVLSLVTDLAMKVPLNLTTKSPASDPQVPEKQEPMNVYALQTLPPVMDYNAASDNTLETKVIYAKSDINTPKSAKSAGTIGKHLKDSSSEDFDVSVLTESKHAYNIITHDEIKEAIADLREEFISQLTKVTCRIGGTAEKAINIALKADERLDQALNVSNRMDDMEKHVASYVEKVNYLDTGLSAQMTIYQEQLSQMQHELDVGLENMLEALAHQGGDIEAVNELHDNFNSLAKDFEKNKSIQQEFDEAQQSIAVDMQALWTEIEHLREMKSDREEVIDALRDKACVRVLNGMVTISQFEAVRYDMEQRIEDSYDKFNNQEVIWQKALSDMAREIEAKCDVIEMLKLREDIEKNINNLNKKINAMLEVLGEPRAAALKKRIYRQTDCLSCSTPAYMESEEEMVPVLPAMKRRPVIGDESKPKEDGDHGVCIVGQQVTHKIDKRAEICQRYCGGSHTKGTKLVTGENDLIVKRLELNYVPIIGTDGKTYHADVKQKPCLPCNKKAPEQTYKSKETDQLEALPEGEEKELSIEAEVRSSKMEIGPNIN